MEERQEREQRSRSLEYDVREPSVWQTFATRLWWVSITPLGSPVVPLEYGSATRSLRGIDRDLGRLAGRLQQRGKRRRAVGLAEDEDLLDARPSRRPSERLVQQRPARSQEPRAAVGQLAAPARRRCSSGLTVVVMPPRLRDGVEGDRVLGQVRAIDGEHVALAKPCAARPAAPARTEAASCA